MGPPGGHFGVNSQCNIAGGVVIAPLPLDWYLASATLQQVRSEFTWCSYAGIAAVVDIVVAVVELAEVADHCKRALLVTGPQPQISQVQHTQLPSLSHTITYMINSSEPSQSSNSL